MNVDVSFVRTGRAPAVVLFAWATAACSFVVDSDRFRGFEKLDADVSRDAGAFDAGPTADSGVGLDAATSDSGPRDAGVGDAGFGDAGDDGDAGEIDGGEIDAGVGDAGPDAGVRLTVDPASIEEGMGEIVAVPMMLTGTTFPNNPVVVSGGGVSITSILRRPTALAIEVSIPVVPQMATGTTNVEILVTDGAGFEAVGMFQVVHLPELDVPPGQSTLAAATIAPLYSRIVVAAAANVRVTGTNTTPAILNATSRITVAGSIDATGTPGATAPAGCRAVTAAINGECGVRDGSRGFTQPGTMSAFGGGGGGSASGGGNAATQSGGLGNGGSANSSEWLVDLLSVGGGGGGSGGGNGNSGGAGGGVFALRTPGQIDITGTIDVSGGRGENATLNGGCAGLGAGGGGGSGSILISGRGLNAASTLDLIVRGGNGGLPDNACTFAEGGVGSRGRTRLDLPIASPNVTISPNRAGVDRRGPMFVVNTPVLYGTAAFVLTVVAEDNNSPGYPWTIDGTTQGSRIVVGGGTGQIAVPALARGLHTICIAVPDGLATQEGQSCIDVAVNP